MSKGVIRSDDENAIQELKEKIEAKEALHEEMKNKNEYYRKKQTIQGYENLTEMQAKELDERIKTRYSWEQQPYPAWKLTNNKQEINRLKKRLYSLEREKHTEAKTYKTSHLGFVVEENKDVSRLQLFFENKPEREICSMLKGFGFKYSYNSECWQRLLNDNARYSLNRFIKEIEKQKQAEGGSTRTKEMEMS